MKDNNIDLTEADKKLLGTSEEKTSPPLTAAEK